MNNSLVYYIVDGSWVDWAPFFPGTQNLSISFMIAIEYSVWWGLIDVVCVRVSEYRISGMKESIRMTTISMTSPKERSRYATGNNAVFCTIRNSFMQIAFCIISDLRIESDRALKWHDTETGFIRLYFNFISRSVFFCAGESIYLCLCLNQRRLRSEANAKKSVPKWICSTWTCEAVAVR